jgi:hypothetical protein
VSDCSNMRLIVHDWPGDDEVFDHDERVNLPLDELAHALRCQDLVPNEDEARGHGLGNGPDEWNVGDDGLLVVDWYECPWGASKVTENGISDALQVLGLEFKVYDEGHYTWNPYCVYWRPGMDAPVEVRTDQDGNVLLGFHDWQDILERSKTLDEAAKLVGRHFRMGRDHEEVAA